MHCFFLTELKSNLFEIKNDDFHHLKNVIKLKVSEEIICVYQQEKYLCEIIAFENESCIAKIKNKLNQNKKNYCVNLILGIIREQKWDLVLQKASELGVDKIIPVEFSRNVVKVENKKEDAKIKRWISICQSASKQSKRVDVPQITNIVRNLNDLSIYQADLNLVCWEEEENNFIKKELKKNFHSINLVVGPEGGLTENEINQLKNLGYKSISLGSNILRAETVPLYLLSILKYEKEE